MSEARAGATAAALEFPDPASLTDPEALGVLFGPVASVRVTPLQGASSFSSSIHQRVDLELVDGGRRALILKLTDVTLDWLARSSGDTQGREALVVREPRLAPVWDVFERPYLAYAVRDGLVGLLSIDLGEGLFPDERVPISEKNQRALVGALARLHARFWDADLDGIEGLADPRQICDVTGPSLAEDEESLQRVHEKIRERLRRGWTRAKELLPQDVAAWLTRPAEACVASFGDLPRTLIHGDVKIANFAIVPGGVAAFDWAMVGRAPAGYDLGWYLAVNASRIQGSKEALLLAYRTLLEEALKARLDERVWTSTVDLAIFAGARMLLWTKAAALDSGADAAKVEWSWWVDRLVRLPR